MGCCNLEHFNKESETEIKDLDNCKLSQIIKIDDVDYSIGLPYEKTDVNIMSKIEVTVMDYDNNVMVYKAVFDTSNNIKDEVTETVFTKLTQVAL